MATNANLPFAMHQYAEHNHVGHAHRLIENGWLTEHNIDDPNEKLETPLYCAVKGVASKMVLFLLRNNADPNGIDDEHIPIIHAFTPDDYEEPSALIVQYLLDYGADPNTNNQNDGSILHMVLNETRFYSDAIVHLVRLLVQKRANANTLNKKGRPPLVLLRQWSEDVAIQCAEALLEYGADPTMIIYHNANSDDEDYDNDDVDTNDEPKSIIEYFKPTYPKLSHMLGNYTEWKWSNRSDVMAMRVLAYRARNITDDRAGGVQESIDKTGDLDALFPELIDLVARKVAESRNALTPPKPGTAVWPRYEEVVLSESDESDNESDNEPDESDNQPPIQSNGLNPDAFWTGDDGEFEDHLPTDEDLAALHKVPSDD